MIKCEICGETMKKITSLHLKKHNMSFEEYLELFPEAETVSRETKDGISRSKQNYYHRNIEPPGCCIYCKFFLYKEILQHKRDKRSQRLYVVPKCLQNKFNIEPYFRSGTTPNGALAEMLKGCANVKNIFIENNCDAMKPRHEVFTLAQVLHNIVEQQKNILRILTINNLIIPKEDYNVTN